MASNRSYVAVAGPGTSDGDAEGLAFETGRALAGRGVIVVTGGLGGSMEAACRGAKSAGGTTIGILPGETRTDASKWIDHVVVTGIGHARNLAVAASGDAVIAIGGAWGTLTEIGFAGILGRPVVILEPGWQIEGVPRADSPVGAVELALSLLPRAGDEPRRGTTHRDP
jgi:uncharacterized protein (TIGR00725 family)